MPTPESPPQRLSRRELLTLISAIMALTAVAIDLMLSAFADMRVTFALGESSNRTGQVVTVFLGGLAVAQLFYGPLADRFGRKAVLYLGIAIYLLGAVGSALAPTFNLLLVSRFVWGVGAAGSRVVATAIVRDRFEGNAMAKAMSQIMAVFVLVPVFAPALGAGINALLPWQALFWFCVIWAALVAVWSFRLAESLDPVHRRPLSFKATRTGFAIVARTPVTFGYTMSTVFLQGAFTAYLASSELIIGDIFDRQDQFPFIFGAVAVLFGIAALANGRVVENIGIEPLMFRVFAVLLPLAVLLVVVSLGASGAPNFWLFVPILGLMLGSFMFLMPNLNSAAMGPVGELAGTASALTGAVRMAGGAVLGTIITAGIDTSVTPFAIGMALMCFGAALSALLVRMRADRQLDGVDLALDLSSADAMSPSTDASPAARE
jgi:MFS transporter, DHA1 family, multidrug resistance protein